MRTAVRRHAPSPLPVLLFLAVLLFSAGLAAGWAGASAIQPAARRNLGAPKPVPAPAQTAPPEPPPTASPVPPADKPAPAGEDWPLLLVNGEHPLPEGFPVPELTQLKNGHAVDSRAYPALQRMMDDCRAAGLQPVICSSWRSWDTQERLFAAEVENWLARGYIRQEAEEQAARWVARPGASEHQTGLAVDIVDLSYQLLDEGQEDTPVQRWLMAHCAEYGFILRYPTDKGAVTGVGYEPWHYRYVGAAAARAMLEGGLCLEEYLGA